jgi:hypothetical protein
MATQTKQTATWRIKVGLIKRRIMVWISGA